MTGARRSRRALGRRRAPARRRRGAQPRRLARSRRRPRAALDPDPGPPVRDRRRPSRTTSRASASASPSRCGRRAPSSSSRAGAAARPRPPRWSSFRRSRSRGPRRARAQERARSSAAARDLAARKAEADAAAAAAQASASPSSSGSTTCGASRISRSASASSGRLDPATEPAMERWLADARERRAGSRSTARADRAPAARDAAPSASRASIRPSTSSSTLRDACAAPPRPRLALARDPERPPDRVVSRRAGERGRALAALESGLASRPVYRSRSVEDQWLHDNLARLVARLEALTRRPCTTARSPSIERRARRSRARIEADEPRRARRGVARGRRRDREPGADPRYGGLAIDAGPRPRPARPRSGVAALGVRARR